MFDQAKADEICERLSKGETLSRICKTPGFPDPSTVWNWRQNNPEFFKAIAHARELGHDAIADDTLGIADDGSNDTYLDDDGFRRVDHDVIQRSKLRVETRLKLLAKWDPKRYGDRVVTEHDGKIEVIIRDMTREK